MCCSRHFLITATVTVLLLSLLPLLLLRHHHHHLPLHHHLVLDGARHSDEGERHLDLPDLSFSQHLLADVERRREADLLVQEDAAAAGHLGAEHGRDQTVDEDAVDDGRLKGGGLGVDGVQVEGVVVARELGEQLHVTGGERFGEGGSLADVEQPAGGRRDAQPQLGTDAAPPETHPENKNKRSVQLQLPAVSRQREQERRHLKETREDSLTVSERDLFSQLVQTPHRKTQIKTMKYTPGHIISGCSLTHTNHSVVKLSLFSDLSSPDSTKTHEVTKCKWG